MLRWSITYITAQYHSCSSTFRTRLIYYVNVQPGKGKKEKGKRRIIKNSSMKRILGITAQSPSAKRQKAGPKSASGELSTSTDSSESPAVLAIRTAIAGARPRQWHGGSVLSVGQFTRAHLDDVFQVASAMKQMVNDQGGCDILKGRVLGNVFYEPSTRTRASFETAAYRLGAKVLNISTSGTSVKKGETLQDTMRCIECYTDALVLRHPDAGSVLTVDEYLKKPLLNAGDGTREHPTQALLDAFTIVSELGFADGITVTMLGDLKYGRTVHSLSKLLCNFTNVTLRFVSPASLAMPQPVLDSLRGRVQFTCHVDIEEVIGETDVLYVTRVQKERFPNIEEYNAVQGTFTVDGPLLEKAKETMIVMHPLPRVGEIHESVDSDKRAVYFQQMQNGMFTRMALLALALLD